MRKKIVAGNWKMNLSIEEGNHLIQNIHAGLPGLSSHQWVVFCTPYTHLHSCGKTLKELNHPQLHLGSQNCNPNASGAYTGEVSVSMLKECGVDAVIIGHSERRQYYQEGHEFLKSKVNTLVDQQMMVIFCCGEPLSIRDAGMQNDFVETQLKESLLHLTGAQMIKHIVIAYEPIWAIGTGVTASTEQAQNMHAHIRSVLNAQYGSEVANEISILYGGSCNANNAEELFGCPDVDGGLIGGAALKAESFLPIIQAMK